MVKENIKPWLQFDNEEFETAKLNGEHYYSLLNVAVTNDNQGGDSERTVITFDTYDYGGSEMIAVIQAAGRNYEFNATKISITLRGGYEAESFFTSMKNLIHCYELRQKLGE